MEFFREVTPLNNQDICVVLDSVNNGFDYPIHNHPEYEINLVMGTDGTRIVGDSTDRFSELDLALIGPYLPHKWEEDQNSRALGKKYRVITIQFGLNLFSMNFFSKERFHRIKLMLENSRRGLLFDKKVILSAIPIMVKLTEQNEFQNVIYFLRLLNLLAGAKEFKYLSSSVNSAKSLSSENTRIQKAYNFIMMNYKRPDFMIQEVSDVLNMSTSAFSHFFKKHAFRSFSSFLIDLRLGYACNLLLSSDFTMAQISVKSGFNNISNFNRLFKKYKECTPKEYKRRLLDNTKFDWADQRTPWQFIPDIKNSTANILPDSYSTRLNHV
ncbi:AraC family transcriptional regulator [Portibacter lacus]|uniref:AraC family transcriptional regulator n=1 Tax=Portibacter lacus TaxID=1099794 RepID=A0AA37WDN7_9BACT|nr:AraC family transcriptional regulator [Portibacter lacus]GLR17143.1 AraC family transcriptional regulator [Portibacter lacus]